jgi:predicted transcriptional regulator
LDALATWMEQPKSRLIKQALRNYIVEQSGHEQAIEEGITEYRSGKAEVAPHELIMEQLEGRIQAKMKKVS